MHSQEPPDASGNLRASPTGRDPLHRINLWILAAFIIFHAAMAAVWIRVDATPPYWDEAWYLYQGAVQFDTLRSGDLSGWAEAWLRLEPTRPSLVPVLTIPFFALFGISDDSGLLVNVVAWILLLLTTYALGRAIGGRRSGLLATLLIGSYPVLIGLVHILLVELVMVAFVAGTLYALWSSDGLRHRRWAVAAGILSGLGALTKVFFVAFVVGPWLVTGLRGLPRREDRRSWRSLANLALGLAVAALIAGSWYVPNLRPVLDRTFGAGLGAEGAAYGPTNPLHWTNLAAYLVRFVGMGISFAGTLALIAGAVGLALTVRRDRTESGSLYSTDRRALLFLASSAVVGYALFTSLNNQDLKHVTGILPAVAVLSGWGIARLPKRRWLIVASVILAVSVFQATVATLPGQLQSWQLRVPVSQSSLWFLYPAQPHELVTRYAFPDGTHWPLLEILSYALLVADLGSLPDHQAHLAVVPDYPGLEAHAFRFEAYRRRMPVVVAAATLSNLPAQQVLIDKTGDPGWDASEPAIESVNRAITQAGSGFQRMPRTFSLPDGSECLVYGRRLSPLLNASPVPEYPSEVEFGGAARYLGFDVVQSETSDAEVALVITHYWESLQATQEDYSVFVHLLVPETDAIVVQDDHVLFPHTYPTTLWQPGRFLYEQRQVLMPDSFSGPALKLRLGLYNEDGRLPVSRSGEESSGATFADVGTIEFSSHPTGEGASEEAVP